MIKETSVKHLGPRLGGTPIFGNTHIYIYILDVAPSQ